MRVKRSLLAILTFLIIGRLVGIAEEGPATPVTLTKKQVKALEGTASTPQEHLSLSAFYRDQANKYEEKVRYHQEMAEMYRKTPLPFDGKLAVPMQRHCKDWEFYYGQQAERSAVLASYHEEKAGVLPVHENAFAQPGKWGLRTTGFEVASSSIRPTPQQNFLFHDLETASVRLYDLTRILTYFVSAKGEPAVELPELRKSAAALFETQQRFFGSLTDQQRTVIDAQIGGIDKLQRDVEKGLERLGNGKASPASNAYFNTAKRIKGSLENWHSKQQEIAVQLGIQN